MNYKNTCLIAFLLLFSVNKSFPMYSINTLPNELKTEITLHTLDGTRDEEAGMKQLAVFDVLSKDWHALVSEIPQLKAFVQKYEMVPVFYPVSSRQEALELLKKGIASKKDKVEFLYIDLDIIRVDKEVQGIFWQGKFQRVGVLVDRNTAMVHNKRLLILSGENSAKYVQSKMPLSRYLQQRIKGKKLQKDITSGDKKHVILDKITAEPGIFNVLESDLIYHYTEPHTFIEAPISADNLIKNTDKKFPIHVETSTYEDDSKDPHYKKEKLRCCSIKKGNL
jgi:hypothetical protein